MATTTRTTPMQLADGTSLSGQNIDQAMSDVSKYIPQRQRPRSLHRFVRQYTPQNINGVVRPFQPPWLYTHNFAFGGYQPPTTLYNEYRFHGYRTYLVDPTFVPTLSDNGLQYTLSTKRIFPDGGELVAINISLLTDSERDPDFIWPALTERDGQWIDNVIVSVEIQSPFAISPGDARYQSPCVLKRDFRVSGWFLQSQNGNTGVVNASPPWPGNNRGLNTDTGLCIEVRTPVSIPPGGQVTFSIFLPGNADNGFQSVYSYSRVETTMEVIWST